ncbi:hypothetical protein EAE96_005082 [Botrytis aclada]|nr:hypothetical protein EAE96_005082 [Botrytis aclada]
MFSYFLRGRSTEQVGYYACETCGINCSTNYRLVQHTSGKRHLEKVKAAEALKPTAKTAQESGSKMIVIVVGKARMRYDIPHDILYNASPYFRGLCDKRVESVQDFSFRILEECEQFGIFIYSLKNQDSNIPTPIGVVPALLELYFIAVRYQVSFLQDRIIDHLLIMQRCLQEWNIKRLYEKTTATSKLRWLCACDTTCILRSSAKDIPASQDSIEYKLLRAAEECFDFAFDVFRVQLIYNTCNWPGTYMHEFHACEFHCHEVDKPCLHINFDGTPRLPGSFAEARILSGALKRSSNGVVLGKRRHDRNGVEGSTRGSVRIKMEAGIVEDEQPNELQEERTQA